MPLTIAVSSSSHWLASRSPRLASVSPSVAGYCAQPVADHGVSLDLGHLAQAEYRFAHHLGLCLQPAAMIWNMLRVASTHR